MPFDFLYMPTFRARQQELIVLSSFDFGNRIYPLLEIIKEKDRKNNRSSVAEIWNEYVDNTTSDKILIDLPVYLKNTASMPDEVVLFNRKVLTNIDERLKFFKLFKDSADKVIPVVSSLFLKTSEAKTITKQIRTLRKHFPNIAIRTFTNTVEQDIKEIEDELGENDILIYDLDTAQPLNPLVKKQNILLKRIEEPTRVVLRSAINTEIQNIKLDHGEIVADADNSLLELFSSPPLSFNAFGDYAGIKKDDLNAGGTISPGFIMYDPIENLYYGFKGDIKSLAEFEDTIVPSIFASDVYNIMFSSRPEFLSSDNAGFETLRKIRTGRESGKSQAKFKRISMEHYLHCIKTKIDAGDFD